MQPLKNSIEATHSMPWDIIWCPSIGRVGCWECPNSYNWHCLIQSQHYNQDTSYSLILHLNLIQIIMNSSSATACPEAIPLYLLSAIGSLLLSKLWAIKLCAFTPRICFLGSYLGSMVLACGKQSLRKRCMFQYFIRENNLGMSEVKGRQRRKGEKNTKPYIDVTFSNGYCMILNKTITFEIVS